MSQRTQRVADLVRGELAEILRREVKDPRVGLATVTQVEVSRDLGHARIGISALGDDEARQASLDALVRAKGFVRSRLAGRVRLRTVPELVFYLDRGAEHSLRISALLDDLNAAEASRRPDEENEKS